MQRSPKRKIRHTCLPRHDCLLHTFLCLRSQHHHGAQHLFIYHDRRHPNCSGTIYIKSPKTPNLFLGIYPKEIVGQVPKRCMYKVVRCCVLYRSQRLQTANISISVLLSAELDYKTVFTPLTITSCHLMPGVDYRWLLAKGTSRSQVPWKTESQCGDYLKAEAPTPVMLTSHSSLKGPDLTKLYCTHMTPTSQSKLSKSS